MVGYRLSLFLCLLLVMTNLYSMLKPKLHVDIHIEPFHLSTEAFYIIYFYDVFL